MEKSGGFDMSKMSMASKIVLGGSVLLLIDSFLQWQRVCVGLGIIGGNVCAGASGWGGDGGFAGVIMGILLLVLIAWEVAQLANVPLSFAASVGPSKLESYIGFAAVAFGILKFVLAVTNHGAIFAWVGLVLIIVVAYGSWMKFQEPEGATPPPAAPSGGGDGGFSS
ncbi:MAG: hypothetical protein ACXVPR_02820 [Actinomycetota bacterium]